jgi:hypothetical protein
LRDRGLGLGGDIGEPRRALVAFRAGFGDEQRPAIAFMDAGQQIAQGAHSADRPVKPSARRS